MDDTDRQLVALLRGNARLPVATLAKSLGVSRGTVQNRIDRLTEKGTIQGFTVRVRQEDERPRIRAIMMIEVEGERSDKILNSLRLMQHAVEVDPLVAERARQAVRRMLEIGLPTNR